MARQTAEPMTAFADTFGSIVSNVERVIQGKVEVVQLALLCLLAEGHLLVEDVPGVGKTSLAKALATSIKCSFGRVQFTPDLLPSDVVVQPGLRDGGQKALGYQGLRRPHPSARVVEFGSHRPGGPPGGQPDPDGGAPPWPTRRGSRPAEG